jgi:hypothetical protein
MTMGTNEQIQEQVHDQRGTGIWKMQSLPKHGPLTSCRPLGSYRYSVTLGFKGL